MHERYRQPDGRGFRGAPTGYLNLVLAMEGKFGIQFEPEEMEGMNNLGRIAALLAAKIT